MAVSLYPTHRLQWKILALAQEKDIGEFTLKAINEAIGGNSSPQIIRHHVAHLIKLGYLKFYTDQETFESKCVVDKDKVTGAKKFLKDQQP